MDGSGINISNIVQLSGKTIGICVQYVRDVKNAQDAKARLVQEVSRLDIALKYAQDMLEGPQGTYLKASKPLLSAIEQSKSGLQQLYKVLSPNTRTWKWPYQSKDAEATIKNIRQSGICATLVNLRNQAILDRLPVAQGAAFDSYAEEHNPTCHMDTRIELLKEISKWARDPIAKPLFWLNGMAGTGKSTISRTVARRLVEAGQLGGSFFFKRGEADRVNLSKFFTTIATQLVMKQPHVAPHIKEAVDNTPDIGNRAVCEQFETLILGTITKTTLNHILPIVIVIDALDECEEDSDIKLLLQLLARSKDLPSSRLKVFVTGRPELPIRLGFYHAQGTYEDFILHEISRPVIENDINAFLRDQLQMIRKEYNALAPKDRQLEQNWPSDSHIQMLTNMTVPLFIFAATACRFIGERRYGNPKMQLETVLEHKGTAHKSQLDATYLLVLSQQTTGLPSSEVEKIVKQFRQIVGAIVILSTPLSISTLSHLLGTDHVTVGDRLDMLHSVLSIPFSSSSPIRLLHLSFREFLTNTENRESNPFWVDEKETHRELAFHCLRIMDGFLRADMCDLRAPGALRAKLKPKEITSLLPSEIQYACLYWVDHIEQARIESTDGEVIHGFLKRHFLHWLEAMCLIGRAFESVTVIRKLQALATHLESQLKASCEGDTAEVGGDTNLYDFLVDTMRFIRYNVATVDVAPMQIYSSALVFTPTSSLIRKTFRTFIPHWVSLQPKIEDQWDPCLQKLEWENYEPYLVAFSTDSTLLASASRDVGKGTKVRIWRTDTGQLLREIKSDFDTTTGSVAFSADLTSMAISISEKIMVCEIDTCECLQTLVGHEDTVSSLAFSSTDSKLLASGSDDKTVRIWRVGTGECLRRLEADTDGVKLVAISADSTLVASISSFQTLRIWQIGTGKCLHKSKDGDYIQLAVFSSDLKYLAFANIKGIHVRHLNTGKYLQLQRNNLLRIGSIAFSPDAALIVASGEDDGFLEVWQTDTGECLQKIMAHGSIISSLAFSSDSRLVVSCSHDSTVRIWQLNTGKYPQTSESYRRKEDLRGIAFSVNSMLAASCSDQGIVRIWQGSTGECVQESVLGKTRVESKNTFGWDAHDMYQSDAIRSIERRRRGPFTPQTLSMTSWRSDKLLLPEGLKRDKSMFMEEWQEWSARRRNGLGKRDEASRSKSGVSTGEYLEVYLGLETTAVAFSPDSALVAVCIGQRARIWRVNAGEKLETPQVLPTLQDLQTLHRPSKHGNTNSVVFSGDSELLAAS
ncbi:Vegetative incompatibility HET-E-1-like protein [Cladobotryum mycophilum]|uniref:Vegetative incompatibility HET-E-1-like protein n=1 Tax=Cladobotryum mycophilum TaxID=491253 RepID=A0ABR0SPE5_9HYPO